MRTFLLLACLLLLPCLASADYFWDVDTNTLVWVELDENHFHGSVVLRLDFNHTVIGDDVPDVNATGWFFAADEDFSFEVEVPNLTELYFLDFGSEEVFVYAPGVVPDGWNPLVEAEEPFEFQVNNLLGISKPALFLLIDDGETVGLEYLEVAELHTVVPQGRTKYFLLIDADDFGMATFGLDVDELDIGVSVNFRKLPSVWEYVDDFGMACTANTEHRCLIMTDGTEFDFDECLDAGSEQNALIGESPPLETCVAGPEAYRQWREDTLARRLELEREKRALAEEKSDPELAGKVGALEAAIEEQKDLISQSAADSEGDLVFLSAVVLLVAGAGAVIVVMKQRETVLRNMPDFVKGKLRSKLEEVRKDEVVQQEGEGKGEGVGAGGVGAEEAVHKPVAGREREVEGGEPVVEGGVAEGKPRRRFSWER